MTVLDTLLIIQAILITIFIFIEAWQLRQLIITSRITSVSLQKLTEDPDTAGMILWNGISGMSAHLKSDPAAAKDYQELMQLTGIMAIEAAGEHLKPDIIKTIEDSAGRILLGSIVNMAKQLHDDPEAAKAYSVLVANTGAIAYQAATQTVKDSVKKTIEKEIPVPKEYRWIVEAAKQLTNKDGAATNQAAPAAPAAPGLLPLK